MNQLAVIPLFSRSKIISPANGGCFTLAALYSKTDFKFGASKPDGHSGRNVKSPWLGKNQGLAIISVVVPEGNPVQNNYYSKIHFL